jgi:hypothetical protein
MSLHKLLNSPFAYVLNCASYIWIQPVPVGARSKAYVYGRSPSAIVGLIPTGSWMFVCCVCCVLTGRGLCGELITRPAESYRLWRVVVCDHENLVDEEAIAHPRL